MTKKESSIYSSLAPLYDTLMEGVDYESWADFIDEIMQTHHLNPIKIMEMGCGTGSLILSLAKLECYEPTGTDLSGEMIKVAQEKTESEGLNVSFLTMNFLDIHTGDTFDCIFSVFDSINYLCNPNQVLLFLNQSQKILRPNGLLIFDFSTPKNSLESVDHLNEEGDIGNLRFFRTSSYDRIEKLHYNTFEIEEINVQEGKIIRSFSERHVQRAYSLSEILSIVEQTSYHLVAKYNGFDLIYANEHSTRVTIVLKCQTQQ